MKTNLRRPVVHQDTVQAAAHFLANCWVRTLVDEGPLKGYPCQFPNTLAIERMEFLKRLRSVGKRFGKNRVHVPEHQQRDHLEKILGILMTPVLRFPQHGYIPTQGDTSYILVKACFGQAIGPKIRVDYRLRIGPHHDKPPKPPAQFETRRRQRFIGDWGPNLYDKDADLYHPDTAAHPAKMAHNLLVKIFNHLRQAHHLPPQARILDPFGGTGRTAIVAGELSYPAVSFELEPGFIELTEKNVHHVRHHLRKIPVIIQGDARRLPFDNSDFDAIITSPPYAQTIHDFSGETVQRTLGKRGHEPSLKGMLKGYGRSEGQIGRLSNIGKDNAYRQAMTQCYREMHRVLKPNGILVVVVKDGYRRRRRLKIPRVNKLCAEAAGFEMVDLKLAEIVRPVKEKDLFGRTQTKLIGRISLFRRDHWQKHGQLIRYEEVMFFRKS